MKKFLNHKGIILFASIVMGLVLIRILKQENPLVSVIIPAYNHERYVEECITSIANQTYQNIEIIVIDDGSMDNTYPLIQRTLDKYRHRFKRIDYSTQKNIGIVETLNKLISKSHGKYVLLIASDDKLKPTAIQKELSFLENHHDYVLVVGDSEFIDMDSKRFFYNSENQETYDITESQIKTFSEQYQLKKVQEGFGNYFYLFFKGNHIPNGYLIRMSTLKKIHQFTKEAPLEDYYLMLQLSKYGKFYFIDEILCSYRRHPTNTSRNIKHMTKITQQTLQHETEIIMSEKNFDGYLPEIKTFILNSQSQVSPNSK